VLCQSFEVRARVCGYAVRQIDGVETVDAQQEYVLDAVLMRGSLAVIPRSTCASLFGLLRSALGSVK